MLNPFHGELNPPPSLSERGDNNRKMASGRASVPFEKSVEGKRLLFERVISMCPPEVSKLRISKLKEMLKTSILRWAAYTSRLDRDSRIHNFPFLDMKFMRDDSMDFELFQEIRSRLNDLLESAPDTPEIDGAVEDVDDTLDGFLENQAVDKHEIDELRMLNLMLESGLRLIHMSPNPFPEYIRKALCTDLLMLCLNKYRRSGDRMNSNDFPYNMGNTMSSTRTTRSNDPYQVSPDILTGDVEGLHELRLILNHLPQESLIGKESHQLRYNLLRMFDLPKPPHSDLIANCTAVDEYLWRGAAPTMNGMHWLADSDIGTIIDLRGEDVTHEHDNVDVFYENVPMKADEIPDLQSIAIFIHLVDTCTRPDSPCFVYCSDGIFRTGIMVACWRIFRGMDVEEALSYETFYNYDNGDEMYEVVREYSSQRFKLVDQIAEQLGMVSNPEHTHEMEGQPDYSRNFPMTSEGDDGDMDQVFDFDFKTMSEMN